MARSRWPEEHEMAYPQKFEESWEVVYFLEEYCSQCVKLDDCEMNDALRHAKGDNYPFFDKAFVKVLPDLNLDEYPIGMVICKKFTDRQMFLFEV